MSSLQHNNASAWESEYRDPQFLSLGTEPISDIKDFMKWIKKQVRKNAQHFSAPVSGWTVLDLGCGNGKNLKYIIENFCQQGIGYDISATAIEQAKQLTENLQLDYQVRSMGESYPLENNSINLVLDVTSSNSLTEREREIYLNEVNRVLKTDGLFFVRALCLDGDPNAKNLIKQFGGTEKDTYVLSETGIIERVFSREDFLVTYEKYFKVLFLEKTTGYQKWGNQSYKRNYWIAYLQKK